MTAVDCDSVTTHKEGRLNPRIKSKELVERLEHYIPGGVNSPVRAFKGMDITPLVISSAYKDTVTDVDGNTFIDMCGSWGALIHGHAHPTVTAAVQHKLLKGSSYGITSQIEYQLAEKVCSLTNIEKIRFVSSGTEATMSAVRLARGYTGKNIVIKFSGNYHGHADHFLVQAGSGVTLLNPTSTSKGIPQDFLKYTVCLPYNDVEAFLNWFENSDHAEDLAAVIVEPVAGNMGVVPAKPEFLAAIRHKTAECGAVFIMDEVITGFRVALGGAQELYTIKPDLTCYGKIIGGGFPVAAFGGKAQIMDYLAPLGPVYQAGTLSGNPVAMESGYQTISLLEKPGFYQDLQEKTDLLLKPIQEYLNNKDCSACLNAVGSMFTIFFGRSSVENMEQAKTLDTERYKKFFHYLFERGVYIPPAQYEACFVSMAHDEKNLIHVGNLVIDFFERYDEDTKK